jgi:hypothetical protein
MRVHVGQLRLFGTFSLRVMLNNSADGTANAVKNLIRELHGESAQEMVRKKYIYVK